MKFFSLATMAVGATACVLTAVSAHASIISVDIHPASASEIADDAALADATVIDLLIDSQADLMLSYDITLSTTGTVYNHPLETADDGAPSPALIPANPSLGADSHVAFGSVLGGDLSSPSGTFPVSIGAPLPIVTHNGLLARITVLGDAEATITGQVFVSTDGVTSTSIPFDSLPTGITGDLDGDGFVGINDLNIVLGNWNQNVPPANPLADPSGDGFVGIDDLNAVLGNWNAGTPPAAGASVPEPGTLALLTIASFAALRSPRRAV